MAETMGMSRVQLVGPIAVRVSSPVEAAHELCRIAIATDDLYKASHVHLVNAYTVALADADHTYAEMLSKDAINFPDGKPIALLSVVKRQTPCLKQVRGPQLFLDGFDLGRQYGLRHYLLGSSPEVLAKLQKVLLERYPGCDIVGSYSPPFRPLTPVEVERQDAQILNCNPHIIWVGLGTPKQDYEAARLAYATGITSVAVGAAFDFAAGTTKEAPRWMRTFSLEWLFRLCTEPRRLWKRYVFGNLAFLRVVLLNSESRAGS